MAGVTTFQNMNDQIEWAFLHNRTANASVTTPLIGGCYRDETHNPFVATVTTIQFVAYTMSSFSLFFCLVFMRVLRIPITFRVTLSRHLLVSILIKGLIWIMVNPFNYAIMVNKNPVWCALGTLVHDYFTITSFILGFCDILSQYRSTRHIFRIQVERGNLLLSFGWLAPLLMTLGKAVGRILLKDTDACMLCNSMADYFLIAPSMVISCIYLCLLVYVVWFIEKSRKSEGILWRLRDGRHIDTSRNANVLKCAMFIMDSVSLLLHFYIPFLTSVEPNFRNILIAILFIISSLQGCITSYSFLWEKEFRKRFGALARSLCRRSNPESIEMEVMAVNPTVEVTQAEPEES